MENVCLSLSQFCNSWCLYVHHIRQVNVGEGFRRALWVLCLFLAVEWGRGIDCSLQHHKEVEQADKAEPVIQVLGYGIYTIALHYVNGCTQVRY